MEFTPNYILASDAGYKFDVANEGYVPYDKDVLYLKTMFKDAIMSRPGTPTDLGLVDTKALVTVNGYVHPTSYKDGKLYIKEATTTLLKTGRNHVGIISFFGLDSEMNKIAIKPDMIKRDGDYTLYEKTLLVFPEQVDGIMFVYMGYIITENSRFLKRISHNVYEFYPNRINYLDKVYELNRYRDIFKELGVVESKNFDSAVFYEDLTSDDTIIKTLTRFNTFLVEFKGCTVGYEPVYLERTSVPNNYRTEIEAKFPMFGGYGKIIEYKRMKFNNVKWTLLTTDAFYERMMFSYKPEIAINVINNTRKISETYDWCSAYLLKFVINKVKS